MECYEIFVKSAEKSIVIRELKGLKEISAIFPLIVQSNPEIDKTDFNRRLKTMLKENYRCIGAYVVSRPGDNSGKLVGCAGFWFGTRFWCDVFIEPDNVVIAREYRRYGIGRKLMAWIEAEGKRKKCRIIKLETYAANLKSRAFYATQSYEELGLVIVKPLGISAEEWQEQLAHKAK